MPTGNVGLEAFVSRTREAFRAGGARSSFRLPRVLPLGMRLLLEFAGGAIDEPVIGFVNAFETRKNGFAADIAVFSQSIGIFHQSVRFGLPIGLIGRFFGHRTFLDFLCMGVDGCHVLTSFRRALGVAFGVPNRSEYVVERVEGRVHLFVLGL